MAEFTINDKMYRSGKMDTMQQMHVARRVAPIIAKLAGLGKVASSISATGVDGMDKEAVANLAQEALGPLAEVLSTLPDEHFDYIVAACLKVVQRKDGADTIPWAPVYNVNARMMQFQDIDLPVLLQIVTKVIQENLGSFFPAGR